VNVENVFDARYFPTAHNNNNITPGAPRSVFAGLSLAF
jgi:catecholate siderophore receptor